MEENEELDLEWFPQLIRSRVRSIPIAWSKLIDVPEYNITFTFEVKKEHSTLMETE